MTIIFSAAAPFLIVMTVDSAVTMEFSNSREYTTGRKSYFYPGVGCVATWGNRTGNQIGQFLEKHRSEVNSIEGLTSLVNQYLVEEYRPHELDTDEVGYHVAGFDPTGHPRLSHVFWGYDRPRSPEQQSPKYEKYDHSPAPQSIEFLYNGRNDLAEVVVSVLLNQISLGKDVRHDIGTPIGLVQLGDFVARFAAELTPEVGPPFTTYLISPQNQSAKIQNERLNPIDEEVIISALRGLGYTV